MASVASQLREEITAHAQSDSLEEAREICADGTYFLNNLCINLINDARTHEYKKVQIIIHKEMFHDLYTSSNMFRMVKLHWL